MAAVAFQSLHSSVLKEEIREGKPRSILNYSDANLYCDIIFIFGVSILFSRLSEYQSELNG